MVIPAISDKKSRAKTIEEELRQINGRKGIVRIVIAGKEYTGKLTDMCIDHKGKLCLVGTRLCRGLVLPIDFEGVDEYELI